MAYPEYCIGLTYPPQSLSAYDPPIAWPLRSTPEKYSVSFTRGDGSQAGHGHSFTVWEFDLISQLELNHLLGLLTIGGVLKKSRSGVFIKTRSPENHDVFQIYTSIMILPDGLTQARLVQSGIYSGLKFEFRHLEPYP